MRIAAPVAVVLAITATAQIAAAYILPAEAILGSIARRREGLAFKSVVVTGTTKKGATTSATLVAPEQDVWEAIVPGGAHRREIRGGEKAEVTLTVGARRWTWKDGERGQAVRIKPDPIAVFLANTNAEARGDGRALIDAYGIDLDTVSLSRLDRTIAYVIGAKPWELEKPQLWIDKSFRVPIRLIDVDPKTNAVTDTRYIGFGAAQTGEWWPRKIEVYKDGQLVEVTTYTDVEINEPLDKGLFTPPGG